LEFIKRKYLSNKITKEGYPDYFYKSMGKGAAKGNRPALLGLTTNWKSMWKGTDFPIRFFYEKTFNEKLLLKASKYGSFEFLESCIEGKSPSAFYLLSSFNRELAIKIFSEAFKYGHIKIMQWLVFEGGYIDENDSFRKEYMTYDDETKKDFFFSVCQSAISSGSLNSLEWAFSKGILGKEIFRDYEPKLSQFAAEKGRIDILNFLKSHNLEHNDPTCAGAALGNSL
jgi:hypothetical protein